jgi:hypothetical protein
MKIRSIAAKTAGVLGCAVLLSLSPANAGPATTSTGGGFDTGEPFAIGAEASVGYDSSYIFRGVDFGDNLIWGDVNLTMPVTDGVDLNVGVWYAGLADDDYTELDVYGGLSVDMGAFELGVGLTWYYFPDTDDDALEPGISIGTSAGPIDLSLGYYYDLEADGSYIELAAQSEIELSDTVSLVPGASISYADSYYGVSGFNNIGLSLAMPIAISDNATLTPYIAGSIAIDALDDVGEDDHLYGGVSLSISF